MEIDVATVQPLVEQNLAVSQPTLVMVSMTEPAHEAVASEDQDSQSSADEDTVSSLTNSSWVELGFLGFCAAFAMICLLLPICCCYCCCSKSSKKDPIPGPETVSPPHADISTPALQKMWNAGSAGVQLSRIPVKEIEETDMGVTQSPDIETPTYYDAINLALEVHPDAVPAASSDGGHTSTNE